MSASQFSKETVYQHVTAIGTLTQLTLFSYSRIQFDFASNIFQDKAIKIYCINTVLNADPKFLVCCTH
jgi:hypothetical protein